MKTTIINTTVTGTIDPSLGQWKLKSGKLVDDGGVVHAIVEVVNFASGGWDMGSQTQLTSDAARAAMLPLWGEEKMWNGYRHEMRPRTTKRGNFIKEIADAMA